MSAAPSSNSSADTPDFDPKFWAALPEIAPPVSRETNLGLQAYLDLLRKWQPKINLVSPDSLPHAADRHFRDSLQLLPRLLPTDRTLVDIGSGAGFPGLALAIARPDIAVHMVESDAKKCEFMKSVSRETHKLIPASIPVTVHTDRVEKLAPIAADVMTARALAPLTLLFQYALPFVGQNPKIRLVFLKGENWSAEIAAARAGYDFEVAEYPSVTDPKARVLVITGLRAKN